MNNFNILPGSLWRGRKAEELCVLATAALGASGAVIASDSLGRLRVWPVRQWLADYRPTGHNVQMLSMSPVVGLFPTPIIEVIAERDRQHREEHYTDAIDDLHGIHVLAGAALNYTMSGLEFLAGTDPGLVPPFTGAWPTMGPNKEPWRFKPKNARRDLERAAALLLAQLEKMDRLERKGKITDLPPEVGESTPGKLATNNGVPNPANDEPST